MTGTSVRERNPRALHRLALLCTAIVAVALPFRGLWSGKFIGDSFDARWTTTLYEHWYLVFTGAHPLRETGIYFPYPNTLGLSDAFLVPGVIHSLFRVTGLEIVASWSATNIVLQAVFVSGLAVLATQLFARTTIQVIFVLAAGTGYTWVAQLEHPQTLAYSLLVWICVLAIAGLRTEGRANYFWLGIPPLVALVAMSAWYPFFFLIFLAPLALAGTAVFVPSRVWLTRLKASTSNVPIPLAAVSLATFVALMSLWLWIYLPVASVVDRSWDDYLMHAPTFIDFLGANHLGGGVWGPVYDRIEWLYRSAPPNLEARVGLTPLLAVAFIGVVVMSLGTMSRRRSPTSRVLLTMASVVFLSWAIIAVDARGTSPFLALWALPGGDAIRSPMRVNIILSIVVLAVVLLAGDRLMQRYEAKSRKATMITTAIIIVFGGLLVLEQLRDDTARWTYTSTDQLMLTEASLALIEAGCSTFVIEQDPATTPSPDDTPVLESLVASRSLIPTAGGYSGGFPNDYEPSSQTTCKLAWPTMTVTEF